MLVCYVSIVDANEDEMCEPNNKLFSFDYVNPYEGRPCISPTPIGPSCLRTNSSERKKTGITRNVSFPDDDSQIVTGILEPDNPWRSVTDITNEDLVSMYVSSCKKHGTYPIATVLDQLSKLDLHVERNKSFSLQGVLLNAIICETLEEILKRVQFCQINLESTALDDEASVALFDMLEYYESATHLNISSNQNISVRGWQACARMIKKACCLEELEARNTTLNEVSMPILGRALKVGSQLQVLKLENCNLCGRPLIILASALKVNTNLKELYLSENNLGVGDANQLGSMLKCNNTLKLLDISHNNIKDVGFNYILDGIMEQRYGLTVFMAWNNQLRNIAYFVGKLLEETTSLETLNVGQNTLTDEFLRIIREPLTKNKNILRLGLQSTSLTNEAAMILVDVLSVNNSIQRVDLRDNNIQISGLTALFECLSTINKSVIRLDLDKVPRKGAFAENLVSKYKSLVEQIRDKCVENERSIMERKSDETNDNADETGGNCNTEEEDSVRELNARTRNLKLSVVDTRKISLTCESLQFQPLSALETTVASSNNNNFLGEPRKNGRLRSPAPSPIPSPVSSPSPIRSRFHVSKVAENRNSSCSFNVPSVNKTSCSSRFKVTVVEPDDEPLLPPSTISPFVSSPSSCVRSVCDEETETDSTRPQLDRTVDERDNSKTVTPSITVSKSEQVTTSTKECWKDNTSSSNPITERIRKLSWVSPILQAPSMAMESAKIPTNLEKLFGFFHNPFVRNQSRSSAEDGRTANEENVGSGASEKASDGCEQTTLQQQVII